MTDLIKWLHSGDISIQYLTHKYLLGTQEKNLRHLRKRIAIEGWGKAFLDARNPTGHWSLDFYAYKWISSHYTLLDLRYLEIEPVEPILETLGLILQNCKSADGSINESRSVKSGDLCVNGMFLNYASFFGVPEMDLRSVVDTILANRMPDGGFNCEIGRSSPTHSSMHTTISILEGIHKYRKAGYAYKLNKLEDAARAAEEFLLMHHLFKSDKTSEIIDKRWTMLSFPSRWRYDLLRALVYFADAGVPYDHRMEDAINLLISKRRKDGAWPVQTKHAGQVHFDMEKTGTASRWNTLRALRVLKAYRQVIYQQVVNNDINE